MKHIDTVRVEISVRRMVIEMPDGQQLHLASIENIACGSGMTPEDAWDGLALCLAIGDDDVPSEERIEPWRAVLAAALKAQTPESTPPSLPGMEVTA